MGQYAEEIYDLLLTDEEFVAKVDKLLRTGYWHGDRRDGKKPYGRLKWKGQRCRLGFEAHEVAWVRHFGPTPDRCWIYMKAEPFNVKIENLFVGPAHLGTQVGALKRRGMLDECVENNLLVRGNKNQMRYKTVTLVDIEYPFALSQIDLSQPPYDAEQYLLELAKSAANLPFDHKILDRFRKWSTRAKTAPPQAPWLGYECRPEYDRPVSNGQVFKDKLAAFLRERLVA